jgi:hypothetical protein
MQKPTKKQLVDRVTYYETELAAVLRNNDLTPDNVLRHIERILLDAPSLEPAIKVTVLVAAEDASTENSSEAPAVH